MSDLNNPNTDLDLPEVQDFINQMAEKLARSNVSKNSALNIINLHIRIHIRWGEYPCWVEDLDEYHDAVRAAIYARAGELKSKD